MLGEIGYDRVSGKERDVVSVGNGLEGSFLIYNDYYRTLYVIR
jgi:hypothetical protein